MSDRKFSLSAPLWSLALLGAFSLTACSGGARDATLREGWWRGVLLTPGGELPFLFEVERTDDQLLAWLQNGDERVAVPELTIKGQQLLMRMPGYENRIEAQIEGDTLRGNLLMVKAKGADQRIAFSARYGERHRFSLQDTTPDTVSLSGSWAVEFATPDKRYPAVGEFQQQGRKVTGTFLTATGDHRFLEGEFDGRELLLSKFDGGHVFLYRALLDEEGQLTGRFWSGLASEESFTAVKDSNASLAGSAEATQLVKGATKLDFRFQDLAGHNISITDPFFRGKVVIVVLAGSWCPNCHDEAAFLAQLHRERRSEGLEVISLMFEQLEDPATAAEAVYRFRDRHQIQYTTLLAGNSDKDDAAKKLPQLNAVLAFPTTIFVDRNGEVRSIHTGFSGPATGRHYDELVQDFRARVDSLIKEPVPENLRSPAPGA
jgi:thiol-disulfide isomerase/thioredoxin